MHRPDGRYVQRVVGRVPGHDGRGQRRAQRVEDGGRDFELGPVGVVLAVAELQQPLLGQDLSVGVGGSGVDADQVGGELVNTQGLLVEVPLQGAEGGAGAQPAEPVGEAVVVEIDGPDGFAQQGREGALMLGDPGLDVVEAVVPLGDEEEEPDGQDLARGERAFPVKRGREVAVQGGRQIQTLEGGPEDGQVADDFHAQQAGLEGVHPFNLLTSPISENHPQQDRTMGDEG